MFETEKEKAEQEGIGEDIRIIRIKNGEVNGTFEIGAKSGRSVMKGTACITGF